MNGEWAGSEGNSPSGAEPRATHLYSVDPMRIRTMMQSYASAAKLRGGGPILNRGAQGHVQHRVPATSDRHRQSVDTGGLQKPLARGCHHAAARRTRPDGTSPVVASGQSAIRSLRASATIMVLRVVPRASAVRIRYHAANALSFWCTRNPQAIWSIPRRTRALSDLARPRSRRLLPLSSGAPVRPVYPATALRSRRLREKTLLHQHIRRLDADPDHPGEQL